MIDRLFKLTLTLAVLFMIASITAARMTNSANQMEPGIVIRWIAGVTGWVKKSAADSQTPETNPQPFSVVAREGVQRLQKKTTQELNKIAPIDQDLRLVTCPPESIDPDGATEVSVEKAKALKDEIRSNPQRFKNLTELQIFLGIGAPACNIKNQKWVMLAPNGGVIDAEVKGDFVKVTTTNF